MPERMKEGENAALTMPFCCTGTPEELDRDLPAQLRDFVAGHDELKKKQKTVSNGGGKVKPAESQPKLEEKVSPAVPAQSTMNRSIPPLNRDMRQIRARWAIRPFPAR